MSKQLLIGLGTGRRDPGQAMEITSRLTARGLSVGVVDPTVRRLDQQIDELKGIHQVLGRMETAGGGLA